MSDDHESYPPWKIEVPLSDDLKAYLVSCHGTEKEAIAVLEGAYSSDLGEQVSGDISEEMAVAAETSR